MLIICNIIINSFQKRYLAYLHLRLTVYIVQTFSNIKIIIEESRNERTDSLVEDVTGIELEHGTDFELKKEKVAEVEVQGTVQNIK